VCIGKRRLNEDSREGIQSMVQGHIGAPSRLRD
jgi:hypothetical protein